MAQLRLSDLSNAVVEGVTKSLVKILLPKMKKMVREEINRGVKTMMVEIQSQNMVSENSNSFLSTSQAKNSIVERQQRARERARAIVEKRGGPIDPLMDMVINAEDPTEEQRIQEQRQLSQPMVNSKDVVAGGDAAGVNPENIDFSDRLERLGI